MLITIYFVGGSWLWIKFFGQLFLLKMGRAKLSPTGYCVLSGGFRGSALLPSELFLRALFWPLLLLFRALHNFLNWLDYAR